ncbi:MAG: hypothetical protein KDC48_16480 [Planctomycetes bacterium]|nr:hypothetical protein [Planctomycetota bacterium]
MMFTACLAALITTPGGDPVGPPAPSWRPAAFHAVAYVNDSRSHGLVGDALLSVNEAIRLHNGTLPFASLSLAEANQLSLIPGTGSTTDVTWIDIDGTSTPIITVEQDLDPIADTTYGCLIKGFNDPPVFDFSGANITHGFRVPANSANFEDLILSGGPYGIDVTQSDAAGQVGVALDNVTFDGQAQFGMRVTGTLAAGIGRVVIGNCRFTNLPTAVIHRELPNDRTTIFEAFDVVMDNVVDGYDCELGPGGTARFTFDRQNLEVTGRAIYLQRATGANRTTLVEGTHVRIRGARGLDISTNASALTQLGLRMLDLDCSVLSLNTGSSQVFGSIEDCAITGSTSLFTGTQAAPLQVRNVQFRGGNFVTPGTFSLQGLELDDSRFVGVSMLTAGTTPWTARNCSFENCTFPFPVNPSIVCDGCYLPNPPASFVVTNPRAAPHLGSMNIQPESVSVGSTVNLVADLPAGLFGVFVLGFTDPFPQLLPAPLHVYTMPSLTFVLPGVYRFQQSYAWAVPNSFAFVGFDLCAQIAVLPDPNVSAPPIHFPPGRRFVLH